MFAVRRLLWTLPLLLVVSLVVFVIGESLPGGAEAARFDVHANPAAVAEWNAPTVGECGLGDVGAVVGATHPKELAELRAELPGVWFLVPGYGAQGGTAADVKAAYRADGLGAVVNSSRGVVFPFHPDDPDWEAKVTAAAAKAQAELRG